MLAASRYGKLVRPYDDGTFGDGRPGRERRRPLDNWSPGVDLPDGLRPGIICGIATLPDLWQAMVPWHAAVHFGVGGAMRDLHTSPAALIFWPWHAYVDNVYYSWEHCP